MKAILKRYKLTDEEINTVVVFMLLYGYKSVDDLLNTESKELVKHKDWNEEIAACILKMKDFKA
ncbi:hypothetical protein [Brumimicrobium oceani]|uniref:Uncharacterized protein n=1 Tax=Brumimicrobium oceani TaxID=2100725 RepID=A0A2U2XG49_9FLAO|nr:hypothetical protein [Brumimicrobium oceani]PWH86765.1 hypothetical protein DIT68_00420 [Brumimicrobium oceani]